MNSVQGIVEANQVKLELGGHTFRVRKLSSILALRAVGSKALGLVRADIHAMRSREPGVEVELSPEKQIAVIEAYLRVCMVSPKLGDVTDEAADTITIDDLGDLALELFGEIWQDAQDVRPFRKSSVAATESQ